MSLRSHAFFAWDGLTRAASETRRVARWLSLALLSPGAAALAGCAPPDVTTDHSATWAVEFDPAEHGGEVERMWRARGPAALAPLPRLFEGVLSDYHRTRADDVPLSSTLTEREVPLWVEHTETEVSLSPRRLLDPEATYSLVFSTSRVLEITAQKGAPPYRALWPGAQTARFGWWCRQATEAFGTEPPWFPANVNLSDGTPASLLPGPPPDACFLLSADARPSVLGAVSPPQLNGVSIDPILFTQPRDASDPLQAFGEATVCHDEEHVLALGCVTVEDDRLLFRGPEGGSLWWFEGDRTAVVPLVGTERAVLSGLLPSTHHEFELVVMTPEGQRYAGDATLVTAAVRPHLVISEVMANPLGPEPQQEWVEIVNDGTAPVSLDGWVLHDAGGAAALPAMPLAPGQYAVIVGHGFDPDLGWDVPVGETVIAVEQLGKAGLSNSGEPLWLESPGGQVVSRFPPLPAKRAGVSLARRTAWALDDDLTAFGEHADPGASPGEPNEAVEVPREL